MDCGLWTVDVHVHVVRAGYSRIPVYQGERHNIVSMLTVKELALCDPDVPIKVEQLCNYFQHTPIKARLHAHAHAHVCLCLCHPIARSYQYNEYILVLALLVSVDTLVTAYETCE